MKRMNIAIVLCALMALAAGCGQKNAAPEGQAFGAATAASQAQPAGSGAVAGASGAAGSGAPVAAASQPGPAPAGNAAQQQAPATSAAVPPAQAAAAERPAGPAGASVAPAAEAPARPAAAVVPAGAPSSAAAAQPGAATELAPGLPGGPVDSAGAVSPPGSAAAPDAGQTTAKPKPAAASNEINWSQFFDNDKQDRPSERFWDLSGKQVQIKGFMGEVLSFDKHWFLLIPSPGAECPFDNGDETYWNKIMIVYVPNDIKLRYTSGPLLIKGKLDVGIKLDESGYKTMFRLYDASFEKIKE
ncbi:hypothetical protein [Paenibacillus thalictri]|uniref:Uncharacterized protein n=1 Tax=Paenibacillus thalictri TaxID=2527873 RepID=A0A4Q9DQS8_9BACL|nr:hypothetical protein [Paenibacillus thalictri]TBL77254.1 hypothetical protein EYB31_17330 [Paenibacillus thalictri]